MVAKTKTTHTSIFEGGDARIEDYLDSLEVRYEFIQGANVGDFNAEKSLHNQARDEPFDEAIVENYTEAMKNGDKFPPVIASGPRTAMVMADGNHRLQAAIRAKKPLDVYLLAKETPGLTIAAIMHEANAKHGRPTSINERISAGLYLINNGSNAAVAAAKLSIPKRLLVAASAKQKMDMRFIECGVAPKAVEALTEGVKRRLSNISTDEGFLAAVDLCIKAHLTGNEANRLTIEVNEVRSSAKQVKVVEAWREEMVDRIQGTAGGTITRAPRGPKARVSMALGAVAALPDDLNEISQFWQGAEREEAIRKIRSSARRLNELARVLSS